MMIINNNNNNNNNNKCINYPIGAFQEDNITVAV